MGALCSSGGRLVQRSAVPQEKHPRPGHPSSPPTSMPLGLPRSSRGVLRGCVYIILEGNPCGVNSKPSEGRPAAAAVNDDDDDILVPRAVSNQPSSVGPSTLYWVIWVNPRG